MKKQKIVLIVWYIALCHLGRYASFRQKEGWKGRAVRFSSLWCNLQRTGKRIFARIPHEGLLRRSGFLEIFLVFCLTALVPAGYAQAPISPATADSLRRELAIVEEADQFFRQDMEHVQQKFGGDSKEMKQLMHSMEEADSLNFIKVSAILEKFGWPGSDDVGLSANTTVFMVIQHANLDQQERYLPLMRKAVKEGKAQASQLALLEDRVALLSHHKQRYGSQVKWNMKTNEYSLLPLEDPQHVDERRKEAGLQPLKDYLKSCCNLDWNVEAYLKEQETIEKESP